MQIDSTTQPLTAQFDYLRFVVPITPVDGESREQAAERVLDCLRLLVGSSDWSAAVPFYQYAHAVKRGGMMLLWGGEHTRTIDKRDTVCLQISGQGISDLERSALAGDRSHCAKLIRAVYALSGYLTRCDIAWDDRGEQLPFEMIIDSARLGAANYRGDESTPKPYTSRWQAASVIEGGGRTAYFGSYRDSESFLRVYDKRAEQLSRARGDRRKELEQTLPESWIRVELVLQGQNARNFGNLFDQIEVVRNPARFAAAVLRGKILFREGSSESHQERLPIAAWWAQFLAVTESMRLYRGGNDSTIQTARLWLRFAVARSLALVYECDGWDGIDHVMRLGQRKLSSRDFELIAAEAARNYEQQTKATAL
jgi:hypothetical protein